ncbi:putative permease [Gemmatirosa kalamazoonensis]|uniref:Putative permease n=1 Tax=Gemmatirosa kalamazoonensis TaxID=861299 RepID=W0RFL1_9BACT|nr:amino acid permease [Gemmatirosa kalamazoonensis]AHG89884.1 putative permease [Gemmatirosa kalamazoonensis]
MTTTSSPEGAGYARRLGLFSATMLVVGGIIGSGIFLNPAIVARRTGSAALTLGTWALGAVIALLGAFIFAELGRRRPHVGGGYAYLRDAFGPLPAFLYAWALLLAIATGAIAAVAVTFASYAAPLVGLGPASATWLAVAPVVLLSIVNVLGVEPGAATQSVFTVLKLVALGALLLAAVLAPPGGLPSLPTPIAAAPLAPPTSLGAALLAVSAALVPVLFAYGGWQQTNFVAGELRDPERTLPRALILGVLIVVVVYLGANAAYLRTLGVAGLAASSAPAADTMSIVAGVAGRRLIAAGIAASTFGFLDLVILVTPRVYQAMAQDGLFFAGFARLHPRWRTPVLALAFQGVVAVALILTRSYGQLLDWVVFADWIFFGTTALTLVVFRRRDRRTGVADAGFRAPLYPASVALFVLAAAYVVLGSVVSNPGNALRGALLLLAGVPVFLFWRSRREG